MKILKNLYPSLYPPCIIIENVKVSKSISQEIIDLENEVRKKYKLDDLINNHVIRAYRDFFWSIGIDPTKERPSSEALIRRLLHGKTLYRINNVVNAMNAVSAYTGIVFSAFDLQKIELPVILRASEGHEKLKIIGGDEITIPRDFPILIDNNGEIFSATVYRDGEKTKVTLSTKQLLLIAYIPTPIERAYGLKSIKMASDLICKVSGGKVVEKQI